MSALDKRLAAVAQFVTSGGYPVDVGTDHGYLPIALIQSGRSQRVLATDLNDAPLESARRNIAFAGLSGSISLQRADGLEGISLADKTDVLIAGMGGILISEILEKRHPVTQNLVLQPMTQLPYLRWWLCQNGYQIRAEEPVADGKHGYCVIRAQYDGISRSCDDVFAELGIIPGCGRPDEAAYLALLLRKFKQKAEGLGRSEDHATELAKTLSLIDKIASS